MLRIIRALLAIAAFVIPFLTSAGSSTEAMSQRVPLTRWHMQSSCKLQSNGAMISTADYRVRGWHATTLPSTVLAALVADKSLPDPFYDMNLRSIPGTTYPANEIYSRLPMPDDSPYKCSWWYRTVFNKPVGEHVALHFDGINYRANIWFNGKQIANSTDVAGAFRTYEFAIGSELRNGVNVLAVEVFAPTEKDLAINWVDWAPTPPDKNMGLWRDVYLTTSGPVAIENPQVISHVDAETLASAELTITAELHNNTGKPVSGTLQAEIEHIMVREHVEIAPHETKLVTFAPDKFPSLNVKNPRLWWPYQMGTPNLYRMTMKLVSGGATFDTQHVRFGIREVTSELTDSGHRLFRINGKKILIRGGGWAPDLLLRSSHDRLDAEMRYVRDMNLNTIRLEGKLETDEFYNMADERGILIMPGWCCCDIWEEWTDWPAENQKIAVESLKSQVLRMRNHPSIFVWLNGSDKPPVPEVERAYLDVLDKYHWPNPVLSSATEQKTEVTGASGVKMPGPYDWVPPAYWLTDAKHGGAYGFNTETGPGPAVPPIESLRKFLPEQQLWPVNDHWNYHAGLEGFTNIDTFRKAMEARYGPAANLEEFTLRSQAMAYEGERAMFEAYSRNKYDSTGLIQWMLNNAWPSVIWHLYDYYLMPAGGYFGAKKANEPLHIMYSYDDRSVWAINSTYTPVKGLTLHASLYDMGLKQLFTKDVPLDIAEDTSLRALQLPEVADLSTTYFVRLELRDHANRMLSTNFYWLSTKPDVYDWEKTDYRLTPVTEHADLTSLASLPKVQLHATSRTEQKVDQFVTHVKIKNPTDKLAFMIRARLLKGTAGDDVLPILWSDNFITLMPGEEREIVATYASRDLGKATPRVKLEGWNIGKTEKPAQSTSAR